MSGESKILSGSMQMYLVEIKRLAVANKHVPLSILAEALDISPVSVNEMCRKLDEMDLIRYLPYKGARLTSAGEKRALQILRSHRLWEVFLVDKLHFSYEAAHEMADNLEHVTSSDLADRLEEFLGNPAVNPRGKMIPTGSGQLRKVKQQPLSEIPVGVEARIFLEKDNGQMAQFLKASGITSGAVLMVLARSKKHVLIRVNNDLVHLSSEMENEFEVIMERTSEGNGICPEENSMENNTKEQVMKASEVKTASLKTLKVGQRGIVIGIKGSGPIKQRMMDMGLVPGSEVKVVRIAPLGDPIEIKLKGYNLSLRKSEAHDVEVEVVSED